METTTVNAVIAGSIGLVTGAIGSLVAPWIHWGVEKKRKKQDRRIELIKECRDILLNPDFDRGEILNHPCYRSLRGLLSEKALEEIERPAYVIKAYLDSPTSSPDRDILLREIARIENEWDLI